MPASQVQSHALRMMSQRKADAVNEVQENHPELDTSQRCTVEQQQRMIEASRDGYPTQGMPNCIDIGAHRVPPSILQELKQNILGEKLRTPGIQMRIDIIQFISRNRLDEQFPACPTDVWLQIARGRAKWAPIVVPQMAHSAKGKKIKQGAAKVHFLSLLPKGGFKVMEFPPDAPSAFYTHEFFHTVAGPRHLPPGFGGSWSANAELMKWWPHQKMVTWLTKFPCTQPVDGQLGVDVPESAIDRFASSKEVELIKTLAVQAPNARAVYRLQGSGTWSGGICASLSQSPTDVENCRSESRGDSAPALLLPLLLLGWLLGERPGRNVRSIVKLVVCCCIYTISLF